MSQRSMTLKAHDGGPPGKRTRAARRQAVSKIRRVDSMDSVVDRLEDASLEDSPNQTWSRNTSDDEEIVYADGLEPDEIEEEDDETPLESSTKPVVASSSSSRRQSGRGPKPTSNGMYSNRSSASSTPRKMKHKKKRRSCVYKKSSGTASKQNRAKTLSKDLSEIVSLRVDGRALPGRETEFHQIRAKLSTAIKTGQGLCLYLSGVPGTGKTATVREVIGSLQQDKVPDFDYVEINGMKLSDPSQVYPLLWRHLDSADRLASPSAALKHLKKRFDATSPRPVVVLLDELDALLQKKQSMLYHFFEWTGLESAKLIVIAIANTMDLPERLLSNRISSRMGLNRLNFSPYLFGQLEAIIKHRLAPYKSWFHEDALELCARKVSSVSGDARRAIAFATRAVDFIKAQSKHRGNPAGPAPASIDMRTMQSILNSAFTGTPVWALGSCTPLQMLMLEAISMAWRQQLTHFDGQFYNVCSLFAQKCRNKRMDVPGMAEMKGLLWQLTRAGLIRMEPWNDVIQIDTKLVMLYTEEDLTLALKSEE